MHWRSSTRGESRSFGPAAVSEGPHRRSTARSGSVCTTKSRSILGWEAASYEHYATTLDNVVAATGGPTPGNPLRRAEARDVPARDGRLSVERGDIERAHDGVLCARLAIAGGYIEIPTELELVPG